MKDTIGIILRSSPLWSIPVSVVLSVIAAKEGIKGGFPKKTVITCGSYAVFLAALVLIWLQL